LLDKNPSFSTYPKKKKKAVYFLTKKVAYLLFFLQADKSCFGLWTVKPVPEPLPSMLKLRRMFLAASR
jgi:hypothetical protein